jgi:hypothetical protein
MRQPPTHPRRSKRRKMLTKGLATVGAMLELSSGAASATPKPNPGVFASNVAGTPAVKASGTSGADGVDATSDSGMMKKYPLWQTILDEMHPDNHSTASQRQKDRWVMLHVQLLPDLHTWAKQQQLVPIWENDQPRFQKFVYLCACFVATCVPGPYHYTPVLAQLIARLAVWACALDQYLDQTMTRYILQQPWSTDEKIAYLDREFAFISEPLYHLGRLTAQQAHLAGLPFVQREQDWKYVHRPPVLPVVNSARQLDDSPEHHGASLKKALNDICQSVVSHIPPAQKNPEALHANGEQQSLSQSLKREERSGHFALTTITNELAAFLGSMHTEIMRNFSFLFHRELPDIETYLEQSASSMILNLSTALLSAFGTPEEEWKSWYPTLSQISRMLRLANDCATADQDFQEGKVSSVTITLAASTDTIGDYPPHFEQQHVAKAIEHLRQNVEMDWQRFEAFLSSTQRAGTPLSALGSTILCSTAFYLQMYQSHDNSIPRASGCADGEVEETEFRKA